MLHLRLVVPAACSEDVSRLLVADPRVTSVLTFPGAALDPPGDVIECDVAREATSDVLGQVRALGLGDDGTVTIQEIASAPSRRARAAEAAAPGSPDDALVWDLVIEQAQADARESWSFYAFLTLATAIAAIAVVLDSSVLVVGAMVVGPEFGAVTALATGLVLRQHQLTRGGFRLLLQGFVCAIALTILLGVAARTAGWIEVGTLTAPRPLTGFIWKPDRWSFVVALLAGVAGTLSQTAGRSNALVGVFISVTTVPAAGNLALALALWVPGEMAGSAAQLAINLFGMVIAGVVTLTLQRALWRRVGYRVRPLH